MAVVAGMSAGSSTDETTQQEDPAAAAQAASPGLAPDAGGTEAVMIDFTNIADGADHEQFRVLVAGRCQVLGLGLHGIGTGWVKVVSMQDARVLVRELHNCVFVVADCRRWCVRHASSKAPRTTRT